MKSKLLIITLTCLGIAGFWAALHIKQTAKGKVYDFPVLTAADRTPTGQKIDPKNISQTNAGMLVDLDGDGIQDFVQMVDGFVYFSKGLGPNFADRVTVLSVAGAMSAYSFSVLPGETRFSLLLWDMNYDGYVQRNLGNKDGLPYFGSAEHR